MTTKKYLVTGIGSGLGKYLYENLEDAAGLDRFESQYTANKYDTIIHCAFNKSNEISNHYQYLEDNIFLTKRLLDTVVYKKFIYISSIDVNNINNNYSLFKKFAEEIVLNHSNTNTLVLRCSALVGRGMKPNHITKIVDGNNKISLSGKSTFSYISYDDVLNYVDLRENDEFSRIYTDMEKNAIGVWNMIASNVMTLDDAKELFKSNTQFGDYIYTTPLTYYEHIIYTGKTSTATLYDNFKKAVK